ncbi:MAG: glycosyltransferase family 9 protein [Myxococcota bacterium]
MRSIGILNLTRFGDLVQTSPVLAALRKRHPEAMIHLIVKSRFREAAEMLPAVDHIHEIDGDALARVVAMPGRSFLTRFQEIRRTLEPLCQLHFDQLVNFTHSRSSAVLVSLLDAERTIGFTIDREGHRRVGNAWLGHLATLVRTRRLSRFNLVEIYLGACGVLREGTSLMVRVPPHARALASEKLAGPGLCVAVQLGASQDAKTWPVERFAATVRALARRVPELRVVLVGVRGESDAARALVAACPETSFVNLVGQTRLDELAAVLERCELLLTGDTGTMHLAAAVDTPTCAVFVGLGMPYETAVYAPGHLVLHSRLSCAPCSHQVECRNAVCHDDVPPEWLAELLDRMLGGEPVEGIAALPRADLLRTSFDERGLYELVPVHPRRPTSADLMALAYRAVFLEGFEGLEAQPDRVRRQAWERFGVAPDGWQRELPDTIVPGLRKLAELAAAARSLSDRIADAQREPAHLRELGKRLKETDEAIYSVTRAEPLLSPLGLALEAELEDLPEADLATLANLSAGHYAKLLRRVSVLHDVIENRGGEE